MTRYRKLYAAVAAGIAAVVSATADGEFSQNDAFVVASVVIGALGVFFLPNKPSTDGDN